MSFHTEARLLSAIGSAKTLAEQGRLTAELQALRAARAAQVQQDRDIEWADATVRETLSPVATHSFHTAATDWLGDAVAVDNHGAHQEMMGEAAAWFQRTSSFVKSDEEEFAEQAMGYARRLAGKYGEDAPAAARAFMDYVAFLHSREAASGLDQIDQTIDPNNSPKTTEYPVDVFDNFAPPLNEFNNGVDEQQSSYNAETVKEMISGAGGADLSAGGEGTAGGTVSPGGGKPSEHDTGNAAPEVPVLSIGGEGEFGPEIHSSGARTDVSPFGSTSLAISHVGSLDDFRESLRVQAKTDDRGVEYVDHGNLEDLPHGWAQCGTCGKAWNDDKSTSVTPAPSARCPFEYDHDYSHEGKKTANQYIKKDGDSWVITQKGTGKVLSHHDSEAEAQASFSAMEMHKHEALNCVLCASGDHGSCSDCGRGSCHKSSSTPANVEHGSGTEGGQGAFSAHGSKTAKRECGPCTMGNHTGTNGTQGCRGKWCGCTGRGCGKQSNTDTGGESREKFDAKQKEGSYQVVSRWSREAASGLDQIQQTVDPNNAPKTTPLPGDVMFDLTPEFEDEESTGAPGDPQSSAQEHSTHATRKQADMFGNSDTPHKVPGHERDGYNQETNASPKTSTEDNEGTPNVPASVDRDFANDNIKDKGFDVAASADYRKAFAYASKWTPGSRLVTTGSAEFETGIFDGLTDDNRAAFLAAHVEQAHAYPVLSERIVTHAVLGAHLAKIAGTSTDLMTTAPDTYPDQGGQTPINGPGTTPPLAGQQDAAKAGGPAPYNGADPLGHSAVPGVDQKPNKPSPTLFQPPNNQDHGVDTTGMSPRTLSFRKHVQANLLAEIKQ